jgi:hypothetical protein
MNLGSGEFELDPPEKLPCLPRDAHSSPEIRFGGLRHRDEPGDEGKEDRDGSSFIFTTS